MGNRKENLKKSLGITDYPWSSDDEDDDDTVTPVVGSRSKMFTNENDAATSSRSNNDPISGQAPPPTPALSPGRKNQTRLERELFWSFLNNPHRMPVVDPARPGPSTFQPIESCQGMDLESKISNIERMIAINKLPRKISFSRSNNHNRNNLALMTYLPDMTPMNMSDYLAPRSSRSDRIPPPIDVVTTEPNQDPSMAHQQEAINNPHSEDEIDHRSNLSMSPAVVSLDDDTENVNAEPQPDNAGPEEVVVEIEPDIEVVDNVGTDNTQPNERPSEQANEEPSTANNNTEAPTDRPGVKRKRGEDNDENEISTVMEFNQSVLRLLECPVCMEWMEPPMSQCRRGHLVCGPCRLRLSACPVCRTAFSSVRNRAMESVAELLRYPCRHGCGRESRLRRRAAHEASCGARRYRCPVPPCADRAPVPLHELHYHFQARHLPILKVGRRHKFSMRVNAEQHDNWLVMAARELFHLRVDVDVRTWGFVVYVAYIGPRCNAKDYTYEVTVNGQHNNRKLIYTRATHSDLESSSLNVSRQDCFHLTLDQALNFLRLKNRHCEPDKYLDFVVEISKREPLPTTSRENSDS